MRSFRFTALFSSILLTCSLASSAFAKAQVPLGHVEVRGSGPIPMVLIAGPPLDWRYWEDFMDRNGDKYTMYAVTLAGVAGTPAMPIPPIWRPKEREKRANPPLETPWLDNAVDGIVDMMIEKKTGRAVVVGHTVGGLLALRLGIEHPQLVSAVVTLEGAPAFPSVRPQTRRERAYDALWRFDAKLRESSPEEWPDKMASWAEHSAPNPEIASFITRMCVDTDREVTIRYLVEDRLMDLTDEVSDLRVPTLGIFSLISGAQGQSIDQDKRDQFAPAWHEDIRFYKSEDISVFYTLKEPERFSDELAEFLHSQNITGAPSDDKPDDDQPDDDKTEPTNN